MEASDYGSKHLCPKCETKYYDLKRAVITCPKCGAKPPAAKLRKVAAPAKKIGRVAYARFP